MIQPPSPAPPLDFSAFDLDIRVQDDLFRHVNGAWLSTAEIPADKPLTGAFMSLRDQAEEAVRVIITTLAEGPPGTDAAKIADLYASFMDADTVEAAGADPLLPMLAAIDAVDTPVELAVCSAGSPGAGSTGSSGWTPSPIPVTPSAT